MPATASGVGAGEARPRAASSVAARVGVAARALRPREPRERLQERVARRLGWPSSSSSASRYGGGGAGAARTATSRTRGRGGRGRGRRRPRRRGRAPASAARTRPRRRPSGWPRPRRRRARAAAPGRRGASRAPRAGTPSASVSAPSRRAATPARSSSAAAASSRPASRRWRPRSAAGARPRERRRGGRGARRGGARAARRRRRRAAARGGSRGGRRARRASPDSSAPRRPRPGVEPGDLVAGQLAARRPPRARRPRGRRRAAGRWRRATRRAGPPAGAPARAARAASTASSALPSLAATSRPTSASPSGATARTSAASVGGASGPSSSSACSASRAASACRSRSAAALAGARAAREDEQDAGARGAGARRRRRARALRVSARWMSSTSSTSGRGAGAHASISAHASNSRARSNSARRRRAARAGVAEPLRGGGREPRDVLRPHRVSGGRSAAGSPRASSPSSSAQQAERRGAAELERRAARAAGRRGRSAWPSSSSGEPRLPDPALALDARRRRRRRLRRAASGGSAASSRARPASGGRRAAAGVSGRGPGCAARARAVARTASTRRGSPARARGRARGACGRGAARRPRRAAARSPAASRRRMRSRWAGSPSGSSCARRRSEAIAAARSPAHLGRLGRGGERGHPALALLVARGEDPLLVDAGEQLAARRARAPPRGGGGRELEQVHPVRPRARGGRASREDAPSSSPAPRRSAQTALRRLARALASSTSGHRRAATEERGCRPGWSASQARMLADLRAGGQRGLAPSSSTVRGPEDADPQHEASLLPRSCCAARRSHGRRRPPAGLTLGLTVAGRSARDDGVRPRSPPGGQHARHHRRPSSTSRLVPRDERRDAAGQAALFAADARAHHDRRDDGPEQPRVLRGREAIADALADVCARDMAHEVRLRGPRRRPCGDLGGCRYADGVRVHCLATLRSATAGSRADDPCRPGTAEGSRRRRRSGRGADHGADGGGVLIEAPTPPPPRLSSSRSASSPERAAVGLGIAPAHVRDEPVGGPGGMRRRPLDLRGGPPAASALRDRERVADCGRSRTAGRQPLALPAQLEEHAVACRWSPATSASASLPDLALGRAGAGASTSSTPMRRARPVLERELLQLAQQALLALADVGDERLRRLAVELEARARAARADDPARQLPALTRASSATAPPAALTALTSARRHLRAALLAARRTRPSRLGAERARARARAARRPRPSSARPRRRSRTGVPSRTSSRRAPRPPPRPCRVALEVPPPRRAALPLGQRPQARAALPDPPVVVAVDEVGGLERGHGPQSRSARRSPPDGDAAALQRPRPHAQPHGPVAVGPADVRHRARSARSVEGAGCP